MPRIRGVGELDWAFPSPVYAEAPATGLGYKVRIALDKPPRGKLRAERVVYGKLTQLGIDEGEACMIPSEVLGIARELYRNCFGVTVQFSPETPGLIFIVFFWPLDDGIRHPTKFIQGLARRMTKWTREANRTRAD